MNDFNTDSSISSAESGAVLNLEYAKFSSRVLGALLDIVITAIPSIFVSTTIPYVGWLLIVILYYVALECSPAQATIGKRVMRIKVVSKNGEAISVAQSFIRRIMSCVSSAVLGIGHLMALFSSKKQALQDIVADTYVVVGETETPIPDAWVAGIRRLFGVK